MMFKNDLKVALRIFYKNSIYLFINIFGLGIGIACCMLIMMWVQDEFRYDKFNKQLDDIFCVIQYFQEQPNSKYSSLPAPILPHLKNKFADSQNASRFRVSNRRLFSYQDKHAFEDNGGFADPELFDIIHLALS